jgi:hypothetical protein
LAARGLTAPTTLRQLGRQRAHQPTLDTPKDYPDQPSIGQNRIWNEDLSHNIDARGTSSYKNFWALNVDEVIVAGKLRAYLGNNAEVLMPLNAQLKDVDLVAMNMKNKKSATIQVKSSRSYEPAPREMQKYGGGSTCWLLMARTKIDSASADFFVLVLYAREIIREGGRLEFKPHTVTITPKQLSELCAKFKPTKTGGTTYNLAIWIDPPTHRVFGFRTKENDVMDLAPFLDDKGFGLVKSAIA